MPRDIPVGNGRLLVTFDDRYQIRDVYFPHVGQENHAGAGPCRFGVYADVPGQTAAQLFWTSDPGWHDPPALPPRHAHHQRQPRAPRPEARRSTATTCVDFHRNIFVRKIKIKNLGRPRPRGAGHPPPGLQHVRARRSATPPTTTRTCAAMVHYRGKRYVLMTFFTPAGRRRTTAAGHRRVRDRHQRLPRRRRHLARRRGRPPPGQPDRPGRGRLDDRLPRPRSPADGEPTVYMVMIAGREPRRAGRAAQVARQA